MQKVIERFSEKLLFLIHTERNTEAISIIQNLNLHHAIDNVGKTTLHYAAMFGNSVISQYLIDNNCRVNANDYNRDTPLLLAIRNQRENVVEILLNANAKIESFDKIIDTLFYYRPPYESKSYLNILKLLINSVVKKCSDSNEKVQKLKDMNCPFPAVITLEDVELTKLMLENGCRIDERLRCTQETALHLAVHFLDTDNVRLLLERRAEINATDYDNRTPLARFKLQTNSTNDKIKILLLLIQHRSAFNIEIRSSRLKIINELLRNGETRTLRVLMSRINFLPNNRKCAILLSQLIHNRNTNIFQILQKLYFHVTVLDSDRSDILATAVSLDDVNKVRWLLENKARISLDNAVGKKALEDILTRQIYSLDAREVLHLLLEHDLDVQPILSDDIKDDKYILGYLLNSLKPVLAHLAMIQSSNVPLTEHADKKIQSIFHFDEFFKSCQQQIERMKSINVYESITLYELLRVSKKKLSMYGRNYDFVENYRVCMKKNEFSLCTEYCRTLEFRVGKVIELEKLKERVALIICKISGFSTSMSRTIVYDIVEFLDSEDLDNMLKI